MGVRVGSYPTYVMTDRIDWSGGCGQRGKQMSTHERRHDEVGEERHVPEQEVPDDRPEVVEYKQSGYTVLHEAGTVNGWIAYKPKKVYR